MDEKLEVTEYESLAEMYIGVGDWGSDWNTRQSLIGAANSMLALCKEIRRLNALESRAVTMLEAKKEELAGKQADAEECVERGWDEGHERLVHEINDVFGQKKVLEKLLNG